MVVPESEMMSHVEVESPLQSDQHQSRNNGLTSLGRQTSIYSLTLDEFQHTLCESGKNFGSMNMDEFLNSIWTAEENHAQAHTTGTTTPGLLPNNSNNTPFSMGMNNSSHMAKQLSLSRQGSLTLPGPLSRKTVDEVWSEIQKTQQEQQQHNNNIQNPSSSQRQHTIGEMTLEDFLVKAGVVREETHPGSPIVQQQQQPQQPFGLYPNSNNRVVGTGHMTSSIMGIGAAGGGGGGLYQLPQSVVGEPSGYVGIGKGGGGYQPPADCYRGRVGNGGGYGSPVSPVSPDGIGTSQLESGGQYGLDIGRLRGGRKRIIDGPVEKVVERRQRRMIKNRESAARSRARKQAYTVELEAELNVLKEENAQLKQALAEVERKQKQQYLEEMKIIALTKAQKAKGKLRLVRRNLSCPY